MASSKVRETGIAEIKSLLHKVMRLTLAIGDERDKLHKLLDELNSFDSKAYAQLDQEIVSKTIHHLLKRVLKIDPPSVGKSCQFITRVLRNQSLRHALHSSGDAQPCLEWCSEVLRFGDEAALLEVLAMLEVLLTGRSISAEPKLLALFLNASPNTRKPSWIPPFYDVVNLKVLSPDDVELAALKVVKAIASPMESKARTGPCTGSSLPPTRIRKIENCFDIFMEKLNRKPKEYNIEYYKRITVCLKGVQAVILQRPSLLRLSDGLGLVRAFWLVGLPEYDASSHPPISALPESPAPVAPHSQRSSRDPKRGRAGGNRRYVQRMKTALSSCSEENRQGRLAGGTSRERKGGMSSDSEDPSDCEGGQAESKDSRSTLSSVRFASLRLLMLLIKNTDSQTLMSYWDAFIPYSPPGTPPPAVPSLICSLLRDPALCSRTTAAQCIAELLHSCNSYLAMAETSADVSLAFTPWSYKLAQSLESCQRYLSLALSAERIAQCLVTTLGALATLADVTPYHRLKAGAILRLARCVRPQLFHRSVEVRAAALAVFGSLVSSAAAVHELPELKQLLCRPQPSSLLGPGGDTHTPTVSDQELEEIAAPIFDDDEDIPYREDDNVSLDNSVEVGKTWLVEYCIDALQLGDRSKKFNVEPCRVFTGLARYNLWLLLGDGGTVLPRVAEVLARTAVEESDQNIQTTAGAALASLGHSLGDHLEEPGGLKILGDALDVWRSLLTSSIPALASSQASYSRTMACDILAAMGPIIFDHLPRDKRLLLGFHLFALSRDTSLSVCIAAVRALGVCVQWPKLMEDGQFVLDAAEYVSGALSNSDTNLQGRAAWSLGNLAEALVISRDKGFPDPIPEPLLFNLLESTLVASNNDKLKAYAVRTLGNLLRLLTAEQLKKSNCREILGRSISSLMDCANLPKPSMMKARWNACYSLACVMKGNALCEEMLPWQSQVFPLLCDLVIGSPNFKVRISAAVALAAPSCRTYYGQYYLPAWTALLEALASAENVDDFKEFQHRDNLVDQICLSIHHLAGCVTQEDFSGGLNGPLLQLVLANEEHLRTQLSRVCQRLVPERLEPLSHTAQHLNNLMNSIGLPGMKDAIIRLSTILANELQD